MFRSMKAALLTGVAALSVAAAANAAPVTWDFTKLLGNQGVSRSYEAAGIPIIATAFGPGDPHLFGKCDSPDECGLGLTNDPSGEHEIVAGSSVDLAIGALMGRVDTLRLSFQAGSTQGVEGWAVYGSNVAGSLGTLLATGHTDDPVADLGSDIVGTYSHLLVTADGLDSNILVQELDSSISPIFEPSTLAGLGTALLVFWRTRRGWKPRNPVARESV